MEPAIKNNSKLGLSLLVAAGLCFYFAWQIFQSGERTNLYILQTCGNSAKSMGSESLSFYAECVSAGSVGVSGGYIVIILGVILGIIGLFNLAKTSSH